MMQSLFVSWNVDPVLFHLGSFGLRYYSLGFLFAFVLGYLIMCKMFKRAGLATDYVDNLVVYTFIATLVGARLGHCLFYEPDYFLTKEHWLEMLLPVNFVGGSMVFTGYQGLASHGAAIGILLAMWLYYRKYRVNVWWLLDRVVIVVALAGFFIRMGNLFNSEIYGVETSLPWGFVYLRNGETVPKHPTQLYEALSYLVIFIVCMLVYRKKGGQMRVGSMFGWWLIALFTVRLLVEFVKEDQVAFEQGMWLNMGQILSLPFILAGIAMVVVSRKGLLPQELIIKKK